MTKQSWAERSLFPIFKLCVLLLKLDWNRSTKIAVDSNCWLEAQGQWSSAFRLPGSSKVVLTSITSVLMLDPSSDNLAITWEILSVMPKPSWQTEETKDLLRSLLIIAGQDGFLLCAVCSLHTPSIRYFCCRFWGWILWGLLGFKAFTTQLNVSVWAGCGGYCGGSGPIQLEELLLSKQDCSKQPCFGS